MRNYLIKIRHIVPTFILMAVVVVPLYMAIRWLLDLHSDLIALDVDLWDYWIPFALPWLPVLLFLRKKLRILKFKGDADRKQFIFQGICTLTLSGSLIASQIYLENVAGGMREVETVKDLSSSDHVRSYRIAHFSVAEWSGGSAGTASTSGKYNEHLNYGVYFVVPIVSSESDTLPSHPLVWYGVKFSQQLNNHLSDSEKETAWKGLRESSLRSMEHYDFQALDHFQRVPSSQDRKAFIDAIASRTGPVSGNEVVLIPKKEPYGAGSGEQLAWVFGILGIGVGVLLLALASTGFDEKEFNAQRQGVQVTSENRSIREWLSWFVPEQGRYITTILVDLNIIVFLIMVLSGASLVSPSTTDLIAWGANTTELTPNGEWWRLFTCLFVHGGFMHLFMNIFGLVISGILIETMLGSKRYALLYLLSGMFASLTSLWWHDQIVSVGASGAIFGLFGALLGILMFYRGADFKVRRGLLTFAGLFIGLNLVFGLSGGIDNAAHIGGLLCGVILGPLIYYTRKERPTVW
jgi:rhomboid protease GluP